MELLCIESHPDGRVLAGHTYDGIYSNVCKCETFNVGHKTNVCADGRVLNVGEPYRCSVCMSVSIHDGYEHYGAWRFVPMGTESEMESCKQEKELSISK